MALCLTILGSAMIVGKFHVQLGLAVALVGVVFAAVQELRR